MYSFMLVTDPRGRPHFRVPLAAVIPGEVPFQILRHWACGVPMWRLGGQLG